MVDPRKIRAFGPWILIKADPHKERTVSGLYRPQGNLEDRVGMRIGTVLSVGEGRRTKSRFGKPPPKLEFIPNGIEVGERVLFRGFLHDVSRYHQGIDGLDHSMVLIDDIQMVVEEEDDDDLVLRLV